MNEIVQHHLTLISELFLWMAAGTACFLLFKRATDKRDDELEKKAQERLQAIEAERAKHTRMYSAHREFQRRHTVDRSAESDR